MDIFLIIVLGIYLAVALALLDRRKELQKIAERKSKYLEKDIEAEKKKVNTLYIAEVAYYSTIKEYKEEVTLLEKEKTELKDQLFHYEENFLHWKDLYLYNKT